MEIDTLLQALRDLPLWVLFAVLFAGTFLEYVVPPFPGDTVVVAGAALFTALGWPMWPVFVTVTLGAVAGSAASWWVGRAVARRGLDRLTPRTRVAVTLLLDRFDRHGPVYLVVNRFLAGVRTFFFVAAGMMDYRLGIVLFWSTVSSLIWNGCLLALGRFLGGTVEALTQVMRDYNLAVGVVIVAILTGVGWNVWRAVRTV